MKKNQKNQKAVEATEVKTTETIIEATVEATEATEALEALETEDTEEQVFDATNREYLTENSPKGQFSPEVSSSKYDAEREDRVQEGLASLGVLTKLKVIDINPLLLLLGKWWEVKPARASVKKMIDVEANEKGYNSDAYLQIELNKQIEALTGIQTAIDRLRYAKTYYKPRAGVSTVVPTQKLRIDDEIWDIPVHELEKAKLEFSNKEDLKRYLKTVSKRQEIADL